MLGVHSLAYGLIGGLGTALGPLVGVALDIGLLESTRVLIVRPRGLLDEAAVNRIAGALRRRDGARPASS